MLVAKQLLVILLYCVPKVNRLLRRSMDIIIKKSNNLYQGIIVCQHSRQQTRRELEIIVAAQGQVLDVVVDHPLYGQLIGTLGVMTTSDIEHFMEQLTNDQAKLLSSLTNGIHLHHLACPDELTFIQIKQQLQQAGILYSGDET